MRNEIHRRIIMDIKEIEDHSMEVAQALAHCHLASFDLLREMVEKKCSLAFVWADEGEFNEDGLWVFNQEHAEKFEPLLVDFNTANMLCLLHDAMNPDNQQKFKDFINNDDRGRFGQLVEMGWSRTTYRKGN